MTRARTSSKALRVPVRADALRILGSALLSIGGSALLGSWAAAAVPSAAVPFTVAPFTAAPFTAAPFTAAPDQIFRVGVSRPLSGTVASENVKTVEYTLAGTTQPQTLDAARVEDIVYDDAPEAYKKGRDFLSAGDFANAISQLKLAVGTKTKGDWIVEYGNYYLGRATLLEGTNFPAAVAAFDAVLKKKPDTRFLMETLRGKGTAQSRSKDAEGAAKTFDQLGADAKKHELGILWEARAKLWKALAYEDNDVPAKAKDAFRDAGNFATANAKTAGDEAAQRELASIAGRSLLSEGVALLKDKKYSDAKRTFERIAQDPANPPSVLAGAMNGLGEVLLAENNARGAYEQFAQVRVLYFLETEEAARATYFLGKSCEALGNKEPNGKRKAREYFQEVVDHFSDTSWASRAKAELD